MVYMYVGEQGMYMKWMLLSLQMTIITTGMKENDSTRLLNDYAKVVTVATLFARE